MRLQLEPGVYFAGFSRPFFVTDGAIRETLERLGGRSVEFHGREDDPPPVRPQLDPHYDDDWDEWLAVRYDGRPKVIELERRWSWLVVRRPRKRPVAVSRVPVPAGQLVRRAEVPGALILALLWHARRNA